MNINNEIVKQIAKLGLLLMMGASMSACSSTMTWKEEVRLHDGSKMIVKRYQLRKGSHEIGSGPPIKERSITFVLPGASKSITWKDEFTEDIGHANFTLLALHILNGVPYIVTTPDLCMAYNKWGRPNPPYVIFKYVGMAWQRIQLSEFPEELKTINLVVNTYREDYIKGFEDKTDFISSEAVKEINSSLTQPEFKTILREPSKGDECPEWVLFEGNWVTPSAIESKKRFQQMMLEKQEEKKRASDQKVKSLEN